MKKKQDRTLAVAIGVVIFFLVAVLFVMLVLPMLSAKVRLGRVISGFESACDADAIEITDPKYDGGILPTSVSSVFYGDDALFLSQRVTEVTEGAKYQQTRRSISGSWDVSLSLRTADGEFTIYFDENEFYLEKGTEQYVFAPNEKNAEAYSEFYKKLEKIIEQSAAKE